jgi:hypothetical protein
MRLARASCVEPRKFSLFLSVSHGATVVQDYTGIIYRCIHETSNPTRCGIPILIGDIPIAVQVFCANCSYI